MHFISHSVYVCQLLLYCSLLCHFHGLVWTMSGSQNAPVMWKTLQLRRVKRFVKGYMLLPNIPCPRMSVSYALCIYKKFLFLKKRVIPLKIAPSVLCKWSIQSNMGQHVSKYADLYQIHSSGQIKEGIITHSRSFQPRWKIFLLLLLLL